MTHDLKRVVLKRDGRVFVDDVNTGWKWVKTVGFHAEYILTGVSTRVAHYKMKTFKLKVLDFHNGCGEFS